MKTTKSFDNSASKGKVIVNNQQAEMLNRVMESKFQAGDIVIPQGQILHKEEVTITLNGQTQKVDSAQMYVDVVAADGSVRQTTIAASLFNKYSYGKEFTDSVRKQDTATGIRGAIKTKRNPHITGAIPAFRANSNNEKYLSGTFAFKVGEKQDYTFPKMQQREGANIYDYVSEGDYLVLESQSLPELTVVPLPQVELSTLPEDVTI